MGETMQIFFRILDDFGDIYKRINIEFCALLGLNNFNERINEFAQESIEHFNFNIIENKFLDNIENIVDEELKKIRIQKTNYGIVDYQSIAISLMGKLKSCKMDEFLLEDDFKNLATSISDRFSAFGFSRDELYMHFISKKENIVNMIKSYNNGIIDTLIKLTPKLLEEYEELEHKNVTQQEVKQENETYISNVSYDNKINVEDQNTQKESQNNHLNAAASNNGIDVNNLNVHDIIENIRTKILSTNIDRIKGIKAANPFDEIKPVNYKIFNQELLKYGINIDKDYIKGIVSQINTELYNNLIKVAKENIFVNLLNTNTGIIQYISNDDIINKYKLPLQLDSKLCNSFVNEINERIEEENKVRKWNKIIQNSSVDNKQGISLENRLKELNENFSHDDFLVLLSEIDNNPKLNEYEQQMLFNIMNKIDSDNLIDGVPSTIGNRLLQNILSSKERISPTLMLYFFNEKKKSLNLESNCNLVKFMDSNDPYKMAVERESGNTSLSININQYKNIKNNDEYNYAIMHDILHELTHVYQHNCSETSDNLFDRITFYDNKIADILINKVMGGTNEGNPLIHDSFVIEFAADENADIYMLNLAQEHPEYFNEDFISKKQEYYCLSRKDYGGDWPNPKTDPRLAFDKMLDYIKNTYSNIPGALEKLKPIFDEIINIQNEQNILLEQLKMQGISETSDYSYYNIYLKSLYNIEGQNIVFGEEIQNNNSNKMI